MTDHDAPDDDVREDQWNGSRIDSIIARIVDREAGTTDWEDLLAAAREAPSTWEDLLVALRLDAELRADVESELLRAGRVELRGAAVGGARVLHLPRRRGWTGWAGWAAAGLLAVCWFGTGLLEAVPAPTAGVAVHEADPGAASPGLAQGLAPDLRAPADGPRPRHPGVPSPDVSFASDQVVSELPMQVVETRPAADGQGYEVYYVRRLLQRARVGGVFSLGLDEQGQPAPVAVDPALLANADSL